MCVPMATTNLFTDPVFKDGAFTSNDAARARLRAAEDDARDGPGRRGGRDTYVFWGGREGAEVDAAKDPVEAIKRFREALNFLCEYSRDQKYKLQVRARGQAERAARRHLLSDDRRVPRASSRRSQYPDMVGVNPEVAHEHMAGLNFYHAIAQAIEAGKLFHIDLNDQKPGPLRPGPALRVGVHQGQMFFLVKLLEDSGYDGTAALRCACACAPRIRTACGSSRAGCMRTYLILKEKARQFNAEDGDSGDCSTDLRRYARREAAAGSTAAPPRTRSRRARSTAPRSRKGLAYERLDQLVIDLLLGVR